MKNIIIIGTGFSGTVIARKIAEELNFKIKVIEKRSHIAGNMFDEYDDYGILIQRYGPHIICTNHYIVLDYLKKYSDFYKYTVKLLSFIDGEYVRLPFNFETLQQLVGADKSEKLIAKLRKEYAARDRVPILEIIDNPDKDISGYGNLLFEKAYKPYCAKQWGIPIKTIDKTIMDRVPMAMSYDERYMNKDYQYLPMEGFTKLFINMLTHNNIELTLNTDAINHISFNENEKNIYYDNNLLDCLVFTGAIDELFGFKYGELPYRSLRFEYEHFDVDKKLPQDIVSYPQAIGYTRKTEYKYLMLNNKDIKGTTVATEYPIEYERKNGVPYYPILTKENTDIYLKYLNEAKKYSSLYLCGRLAEFKYYNMDDCILNAFNVFENIRKQLRN